MADADAIERLAREFPELDLRPSQFHGEPALWLAGREIFHTHGDDEVEIRLTRKEIASRDHDGFWHRRRGSDWIGLRADDEALVQGLLRDAIAANLRS